MGLGRGRADRRRGRCDAAPAARRRHARADRGGSAPGIADALVDGPSQVRSPLRRVKRLRTNRIRSSRRRCGSSPAAPDRPPAWHPGAGWRARRRCRRCGLSSVNSVPIARSTVSSLRSSWNSSVHGATSQTAAAAARPDGPNRIWPWHCQPRGRVHRVVGGARLGETEIAQRAGHLGGLAALPAGVEHPDLGVGELGGGDVGHIAAGHLLAELRCRACRVGRRAAADCTPRPPGRPAGGSARSTQTISVTTARATNSRIPGR